MKKINCLALLLMLAMTAMAQSVNIHMSDGNIVRYPLNSMEYFDFTEAAVPGENPGENYGADNTRDKIVTGGTRDAGMNSITVLGYVNAPASEYSEVGIAYRWKGYNNDFTYVQATGFDSGTSNIRFYVDISGLRNNSQYEYCAYMKDANGMLNFANELQIFKTSEIGYIYLIGSCNNWMAPEWAYEEQLADWRLFETGKRTYIYTGTFDIPAGDLLFRFYTYLDEWGTDNDPKGSIGTQKMDELVSCSFDDNGFFSGTVMQGKGSWRFQNFSGGKISMTVNLNNWSVQYQIVNE